MQQTELGNGRGIVPWADPSTVQHLEVLTEGVTVLAGFEHAAIAVRRCEDLVFVAASGTRVGERLLGTTVPLEVFERQLRDAESWGPWRFVPHHRADPRALRYSHVPEFDPLDGPDAWLPLDLLAAPLHDDEGELRGVLWVDLPRDRRRPGPDQIAVLSKYSGVARTSLLLALERHDLAERMRLAEEARAIVRRALGEPSLDQVMEACRSAVESCFEASGLWLTAFDDRGGFQISWYGAEPEASSPSSRVDEVMIRLAHRYWDEQYVAAFSRTQTEHPGLLPADAERLLGVIGAIDVASVLFVPLGAGPECLGFLVLARKIDTRPWSDVERDAARDIGRDLGRAMANARQLEHERALVERLSRLDGYRVQLINTLAHELRNPLTAVVGNLELLDDASVGDHGRHAVAAATRGAERMQSVIDDLLTMAKMTDPNTQFTPMPVDLSQIMTDVVDELAHAARIAAVECRVYVPTFPVVVPGHPEELHRMLNNLVSNAIKYSHAGGRVTLTAILEEDQVTLTVADNGIGITDEDQQQLFREFFRSTNPDALRRPGTGLGLAITARIAGRHKGQVGIASQLGEGTTVTVTLPAVMTASP